MIPSGYLGSVDKCGRSTECHAGRLTGYVDVANLMKPFDGSVTDGLALMLSTDDNSVRNALAMDLAETGDLRVKDALISLIQRPELKNNRGTLVYALENFKCSDQALFLLALVQLGNFEVAAHAAIIIEETEDFPSAHAEMLAAGLSNTAFTASDEWRRDLASELINTLQGRDSQSNILDV